MYPLVREVKLHAIDIRYLDILLLTIHFLHLHQDGIHIGRRCQVDTILGNEVVREGCTKLAHLATLMCQTAQEQGDTYQGITTIVALWIDDSTIALATDDSMNILHLGGHVDLTYRSSSIDTAMLLGHVT